MPGLLSAEYRKTSTAIYTSIGLVAFEGTSVAAAIPELAGDLGRIELLPWVISGFLFASGIATIVAGPLVDALGARRLFLWSAWIFTITGFVAGFSNDLPVLIGIRLIQGGASGVLLASTIAAVNLAYPAGLTGRAFAANSTVWGILGAAAPAIAAVLLRFASWRWIFFVNLPLGLLAIVAGRNTLPERQEGAEPLSIDWRGAFLAAVFTLASIAAVDQLGWRSVGLAAVALVSVVVYVMHARRIERPVLRLAHVTAQPYRTMALTPALVVGAAFTTNIYITVYVAAGRGYANTTAAWSVLCLTLGWTIGANVSSLALDRTSEPNVMGIGLVISTVGLALSALVTNINATLVLLFVGVVLLGVGVGMNTNASLTMVRNRTEPNQIGRAGAAYQFIRGQGFTLGSAAGGAILLFVVDRQLGSVGPVQKLLAGEEVAAGPEIAAAVRSGFGAVTLASLALITLAYLPMISLMRYERSSA